MGEATRDERRGAGVMRPVLVGAMLLIFGTGAGAQEAPGLAPAPAVPGLSEAPPAPEVPGQPAVVAGQGGIAAVPPVVAPVEGRDASLPHDLSPWGMFQAAGPVVKGVMIGLALASFATWTVWLAKSLEILFAKARLRRGLREVLRAARLEAAERALAPRRGPAALMVAAAAHEVAASAEVLDQSGGGQGGGLLDRVASHLARIEAREGRRMMAGTGILATIGSTAPFVGLFGTVWGIMTSFISISEAKTTNLAVVAPGIAEALLATALGLVAAIPAVVIYNHFARGIAGYRALLADTAAGVERLVSRDLDHDRLAAPVFRQAAE